LVLLLARSSGYTTPLNHRFRGGRFNHQKGVIMPNFGAEVSHDLGEKEATARLRGFSDALRAKYADQVKNLEESWNEDGSLTFSFKTMGLKIGGDICVGEDTVKLDGKLPFAAVAFKGKIEQEIREQLERVLR
jgi:hypothetical protein